ncbi:ribonuclease H-like domain, reverse transcriptase, RNA-dependent DNA polymerase [Tanacetum coccineum]
MQEELLQFKLQELWILKDLPNEKRDIGTKWVFRNKKDERGIVIRNKARLVAQGCKKCFSLWEDLKTMFEPHVKDQVWKNQDNYSVLDWKLYDSCGVYSLRKQNVYIHMLVEKRYPLTPSTITGMLNKKLQADHFSEMAYQLLNLLTKQLNNQ